MLNDSDNRNDNGKSLTGSSLDTYIESLKPTSNEIEALLKDLPEFLQKVIKPYDKQDAKLISLIGGITVLSSITARASFLLRKRRLSPMLSTIIFAPPSSDKGLIRYSALLTHDVDKALQKNKSIELSKYNAAYKKYELQIKKGQICTPPVLPSLQLLTFPANATSVAVLDQLNLNGENHGMLLVELELDIYVNSAKKDHGNQNSAMLRLIAEQEPIRAATKGGGEVFVDVPKAAILFVGTLSQVSKLFFSNEDGLFSRFMFFEFGGSPIFDLELENDDVDLGHYNKTLGKDFESLYKHSLNRTVEICFTPGQLEELQLFGKYHYKYIYEFMSENAGSLIKRHVNFVCRVASILRLVDYYQSQDTSSQITVTDDQFKSALVLVKLSLFNAIKLFRMLPGEKLDRELEEKLKFFDYLPSEFTPDDFKIDKVPFNVSGRTLYNWINSLTESGLVIKESYGKYRKA